MASVRRKWKDTLKEECKSEIMKKKPKITVLEEIRSDQHGNIIQYFKSDKNINNQEEIQHNNPMENTNPPHRNIAPVKNLTPTFRKPNKYIEATHEVMKTISPSTDEKSLVFAYTLDHKDYSSDIPFTLSNVYQEITTEMGEDNVSKVHSQNVPKTNNKIWQNQAESTNTSNCKFFEVNVLVETHNEISSGEENNNKPCFNKTNILDTTLLSTTSMNEIESNLLAIDPFDSALLTIGPSDSNLLISNQIHSPSNSEINNSMSDLILSYPIKNPMVINETEEESTGSNEKKGIRTKRNQKSKKSKRKINFNKSYMDFVDEDSDTLLLNEAFPSESSSFEISDNLSSSEEEDKNKNKLKTKCNKKKKLRKIKTNSDDLSSNGEEDKKKKRLKNKSNKNKLSNDKTNSDDSISNGKEDKKKKEPKKNINKKKLCIYKLNENQKSKETDQLQVLKSKSKAEIWQENSAKKKKGEAYINKAGDVVEGKTMKPNPCVGTNCNNKCEDIPEERRENLFKYFWALGNHQRRKDWIAQCAIRKDIKRSNKQTSLNRSMAYEYYINEGEGRRRVCQKFLINTFDITQKFILYTITSMVDGFAKEDMRGKVGSHNKTSDEVLNDGQEFIMSLPLLPSHYCRKDSTRLYLPEEFKNITNLYRIYQNHFQDGRKIMSFKVFSKWFNETFNIGFHVPKKDKCPICIATKNFDVKNEEEISKLKKHEEEKEESYKRFKFHQTLHDVDKSIICASFDLQKVLNTPHGDSMLLYYSRKIAVYNFTIYESSTLKGFCHVWSEADARRGSTEISTFLFNYIKNVDERGDINKIIFYCDSCFGQNKNKTVLSMLRYALYISKSLKTIQINYLIPGHTYMPVDSIHATIETSIKKNIVWAPSQWSTIIELARKNPEPYHVNVINGSDILGFDDIVQHTFKKNQKLQISKICIVTLKKKERRKIFVKHSMLPDAQTIVIPIGDICGASIKTCVYPSKLPITIKKYKDLKKLLEKQAIPRRFADEYLSFNTNAKVADCLPDTDEEDDINV